MSFARRTWIKRIVILLVVAGAGVSLAAGLKPDPIPVEMETVVKGNLIVTVDGMGKTRLREKTTLYAPVLGELSPITLRPGDTVTKDQVIAYISPGRSTPLDSRSRAEVAAKLAAVKASLAEAKRNVERAEIAADLAEREVERTRFLVKERSLPARNLELALADEKTRNTELAMTKLAVERIRLEAKAVSVTLRESPKKGESKEPPRIEVRSDTTGTVLRVYSTSGGPIQPGAPLIEVGVLASVELAVDLPTQAAARVRPGAAAAIDDMGDGKTRRGVVRRVEPAAYTKTTALGVEEQRVDVLVTLTDPPPILGDGFGATAHIEVSHHENVLKVPSGAIFRSGDGFAVFRVEEHRAGLRSVTVVARNAEEVAVRGLDVGDKVVRHPSDKLKPGVPVTPE